MANSFVHVHLVALRYFGETVRTRSMRQAAEQLNVAPSAVNRQILKLEDQLQCKLFHRTADGVRLTAAGEVLYNYILRLERDLERTISEIDDLRGLRRGHVRIACEDGIGRDFLAPALATFRVRHPRVTYYVEIASAIEILEEVSEGRTDIGIGMAPPTRSDVRVEAAAEMPVGVIAPHGSPIAALPVVSLRDLAGERLILTKAGTGGDMALASLLAGGLSDHRFIETNAPDFITALVQSGLGVGFRTPVGILDDVENGRIAFTPLVDKLAKSPTLSVYTRPGRNLPIAGAVLVEALKADLPAFHARVLAASRLGRAPDRAGAETSES